MRYYTESRYTGKNRRNRLLRILFSAFAVLAILIALAVLGNILYDRLERTKDLFITSYAGNAEAESTDRQDMARVPYTPMEEQSDLYSHMDAASFADEQEISASCRLAAELYDGISVSVSDAGGTRYALAAYEGLHLPESLPSAACLKDLTHAADTYGLASCAVLLLRDVVTDSAAAVELSRMGFDEILFTVAADAIGDSDVELLTDFLRAIRTESGNAKIGFSFPAPLFENPEYAQYLEKLAAHTDFLVLDTGDTEDSSAVRDLCESLRGSIGYYPLRILLRGTERQIAEKTQELRDADFRGIQAVQ